MEDITIIKTSNGSQYRKHTVTRHTEWSESGKSKSSDFLEKNSSTTTKGKGKSTFQLAESGISSSSGSYAKYRRGNENTLSEQEQFDETMEEIDRDWKCILLTEERRKGKDGEVEETHILKQIVPEAAYGRLIGKKGSKSKEIKRETGVELKTPKRGSKDEWVVMRGDSLQGEKELRNGKDGVVVVVDGE